jgi:hypothetical protein
VFLRIYTLRVGCVVSRCRTRSAVVVVVSFYFLCVLNFFHPTANVFDDQGDAVFCYVLTELDAEDLGISHFGGLDDDVVRDTTQVERRRHVVQAEFEDELLAQCLRYRREVETAVERRDVVRVDVDDPCVCRVLLMTRERGRQILTVF